MSAAQRERAERVLADVEGLAVDPRLSADERRHVCFHLLLEARAVLTDICEASPNGC